MRIIFGLFFIYSLIFVSVGEGIDVLLAIFILPLAFLVLLITYMSENTIPEKKLLSIRNKIFYLFMFIIALSLNFIPAKTDISIKNIFSLFPTHNLSNYNIYINYAIIAGFLILILPDFKGKAFNSNFWKNNIFFKSLFSKIFFFVVLPIPVFIGFSYLLYKEELKETTSIILQTLLIGGICAMYSYLFIVIKNIASFIIHKFIR